MFFTYWSSLHSYIFWHPPTNSSDKISYRGMVCKVEILFLNQKISKLPSLEGVTVLQQRSFLQYFLKDRSTAVDQLDQFARPCHLFSQMGRLAIRFLFLSRICRPGKNTRTLVPSEKAFTLINDIGFKFLRIVTQELWRTSPFVVMQTDEYKSNISRKVQAAGEKAEFSKGRFSQNIQVVVLDRTFLSTFVEYSFLEY